MRMNFDEGYVIFQYERLSIQHANIKDLNHESENLIKRCFDQLLHVKRRNTIYNPISSSCKSVKAALAVLNAY